jgi:hypothetical protein
VIVQGSSQGKSGSNTLSSNRTRFTSVVSKLESIDHNAPALLMLGSHPHFAQGRAVALSRGTAGVVADTLRNDEFFKDVAFRLEVLRPVAKVSMAVQATLADVTRYWLYFARVLLEVVDSHSSTRQQVSSSLL